MNRQAGCQPKRTNPEPSWYRLTQTRDAQRRPCHLEAEVFDLATKWLERYRIEAEQRYQRLDTVLAELQSNTQTTPSTKLKGAAS